MSQEQKICRYCRGTGKQTCYTCSGAGVRTELNAVYIAIFGFTMPETRTCYECNGSGKVKCTYCNGTGKSDR